VAKFLHLPIYQTPQLKVLVGNGEQLECEGEVQNISVQIQRHSLYISAYVLPIAAAELVLGSQWLTTLDTHLVNYKECFLTFYINGKLITLHGEISNLPNLAQFHQLTRLQAMKPRYGHEYGYDTDTNTGTTQTRIRVLHGHGYADTAKMKTIRYRDKAIYIYIYK